jgi:hypothetical protein
MERRRRGVARAGEVLENPISGQRIIFRKTASDTDGKLHEKGVPNLLQMAVIASERADEYRLVKPPWPVQQALFAVLAPAGRLLGYRARYPEYGG